MPCIGKSSLADAAVSVVVPVLNGARWLPEVLAAIRAELAGRAHEILVIDDGSRDGSVEICRGWRPESQVIDGPRRGAAAAVNTGLRLARFDLVAQIDQDVIVRPGWFDGAHRRAGRSGASRPRRGGTSPTRRRRRWRGSWRWISSSGTRASMAARRITSARATSSGGSTPSWRGPAGRVAGYGYDNDLSYRLIAAGYRLVIRREAASVHRWREGMAGYLSQQYGFGYGRLDLVARHRARVGGDAVSPADDDGAPTADGRSAGVAARRRRLRGSCRGPAMPWSLGAVALVGLLVVERPLREWLRPAGGATRPALLFPVVHLLRDLAWVAAMARWLLRRISGLRWRRRTACSRARPKPA